MATLYITEQGATLRKVHHRLLVERDETTLAEIHDFKVERVILFGNVQISTAAVSFLLERGIDTVFLNHNGKNKRAMLCLSLASAFAHGGLGWYHQGRVVERPDGRLKVTEREYDPETGRRARSASENDLVMLDLQRRGVSVTRVSATGPFRSPTTSLNP